MKKLIASVLILILMLSLAGCGAGKSYNVKIVIPAGSQEEFVYSDEEISPEKNQITVSSGEGLGDAAVTLKPAGAEDEAADDEGYYLTPGMPVEIDAQKGEWYKIGVNVQNPTDEDIAVYVNVKDVEVRIS